MKDLYHAINALNNIVNEEPPRGRQDGPAALKPAAVAPKPKINPAVPAAGPVRANPIDPQAMAATKAAASVVNAPKMAMPTPKPAAPAPRAKVKATAANTKDYDKTVALQKKLGVTADGIMGPQTRAAMAAAAAKKPATPASQVTPTAGDPGMQQAPAMGTTRKVSTVAPGAAPAAASAQDAYAARVAKSNAALAGDVKKAARGAGEIASGGRAGGILDKIGAGISSLFKPSERSVIGRKQAAAKAAPASPNAAGSNFATATDGSISRTDNPRQPSDVAPTTRTAAPTTRPERGIVPGQGAGERTVSVGGQQVRGAEADRAINVAQAGAADARLRMGAAQAGMSVKDYVAQQNRLNKQAGDRMMKTAKASDAGVY